MKGATTGVPWPIIIIDPKSKSIKKIGINQYFLLTFRYSKISLKNHTIFIFVLILL